MNKKILSIDIAGFGNKVYGCMEPGVRGFVLLEAWLHDDDSPD